jgi:hypothetical protein
MVRRKKKNMIVAEMKALLDLFEGFTQPCEIEI